MRLSMLGIIIATSLYVQLAQGQQAPEAPPLPPPAAAPATTAPANTAGVQVYQPYGAPPSPYGPAPTVYQLPPGYAPAAPPAQAQPSEPAAAAVDSEVPPAGFHFEERPRSGLVTAGYLLTLIPWGIGALGATAANFKNETSWLGIPVVGPWMTIGRRDYVCGNGERGTGEAFECVGEVFLVGALILDGIVQVSGLTLLAVGYAVPKKVLVRNEQALRLSPMRVGTGYGAGVFGAF